MDLRSPLSSGLSIHGLLYFFRDFFCKIGILLCSYVIGLYLLIRVDDHCGSIDQHGSGGLLLLSLLVFDPLLKLFLVNDGDLPAVMCLDEDLSVESTFILQFHIAGALLTIDDLTEVHFCLLR